MWFCIFFFFGKIKNPNANAVCDSRIEFELCLLESTRIQSQPYWGWLRGYMTITTVRINQFGISSSSTSLQSVISITTGQHTHAMFRMRFLAIEQSERKFGKKKSIIMADTHKCTHQIHSPNKQHHQRIKFTDKLWHCKFLHA